jgi:hypothetical protein
MMEDKLMQRPECNYQGAVEVISPLAITTSITFMLLSFGTPSWRT